MPTLFSPAATPAAHDAPTRTATDVCTGGPSCSPMPGGPQRHSAPTLAALALASGLAVFSPSAHALFEDADARRAILELRQRADQADEENTQLRRSLLDLQAQIETLRGDVAQLRGHYEQIQQSQSSLAHRFDERIRRVEPAHVQLDGLQFTALPEETRQYEAALQTFRSGDFAAAHQAFTAFIAAHPGSGYQPSARFWLAHTQYAARDWREAAGNFRAMLKAAPQHGRAPDAMLMLAESQLALKETRTARKTLQELISAHPDSEAAATARARLPQIK